MREWREQHNQEKIYKWTDQGRGGGKTLEKMKCGKAVGPNILVLGITGIGCLTDVHKCSGEGRDGKEWRSNALVPILKNKGGIQGCSIYSGINLTTYLEDLGKNHRQVTEGKGVKIGTATWFYAKQEYHRLHFALRQWWGAKKARNKCFVCS